MPTPREYAQRVVDGWTGSVRQLQDSIEEVIEEALARERGDRMKTISTKFGEGDQVWMSTHSGDQHAQSQVRVRGVSVVKDWLTHYLVYRPDGQLIGWVREDTLSHTKQSAGAMDARGVAPAPPAPAAQNPANTPPAPTPTKEPVQ